MRSFQVLAVTVLVAGSMGAVAQLGENPQPAQSSTQTYPQNGYPQTQSGTAQSGGGYQNGYPQVGSSQNGYPQSGTTQTGRNGARRRGTQNGYPAASQQNGGYPQATQQNGYPVARSSNETAYQPSPIPAGTTVTIRTVEAIESHEVTTGQTFHATVEQPVIINNLLIVDRGAEATLTVANAKNAGKLTGNAELALVLTQVRDTKGQMLTVYSDSSTTQSNGKGKSTALKTGIGAAAGAGLGAIFGGGKGAAIGAAAGGGTGAVVAASTKGPQVKVAPETVIAFTIQ